MLNLKHGGHVLDDNAPGAEATARKLDNVTLAKNALRKGGERPVETPFNYLFPQLTTDPAAHLPADDPAKVVADLNALGKEMIEAAAAAPEGNSIIPPVYTYWGQFIDHDLTANTDRNSDVSDITKPDLKPKPPKEVIRDLHNLRIPTLDLDSVYGEGPAALHPHSSDVGFYEGIRFRIGKNTDGPGIPGDKIPPEGDLDRDLPRIGTLLDAGIITQDDIPEGLKKDPN